MTDEPHREQPEQFHTPHPAWEDAVARARARRVDLLHGQVLRHPHLTDALAVVVDWPPAITSEAIRGWLNPLGPGRISIALPENTPDKVFTLDERAALALILVARQALERGLRLPSYVRDLRDMTALDGDLTPLEQRLLRQVEHHRHEFATRLLAAGPMRATPDRIDAVLGWLDEDLAWNYGPDYRLPTRVTMSTWPATDSDDPESPPTCAPTAPSPEPT